MIKDSDKQPDEDTHRGRSRRVQCRSFGLHGVGMNHPHSIPNSRCVHQLRSSLNSILSGFFIEDSSHRNDQVLPQSLPPLLLQEDGGGRGMQVKTSKLLTTAWSFW